MNREFVLVPQGATWCEMRAKISDNVVPVRLVVHLMQAVPVTRHTRTESQWYLTMSPEDRQQIKKFKVQGGLVMEICTAQFWSTAGTSAVDFDF